MPTRQTSAGGKFLSCLSKTSCTRLSSRVVVNDVDGGVEQVHGNIAVKF
jgi:hypothetical protein